MRDKINKTLSKLNPVYIYIYIYRLARRAVSSVLHCGRKVISKDLLFFKKLISAGSSNIPRGIIPRCSGTFSTTYIKRSKYLRVTGTVGLVAVITLLALAAFPVVYHENIADAAGSSSTSSTTSLNMVVGQENAKLDLSPQAGDGTFAMSTGTNVAAFGITTDSYTGYTLTIAANDNTGRLVNSTDSTSYLASIPNMIDKYDFDNSSSYNGMWGYQPSKYNSTDNLSFYPSPTTTPTVLDKTSGANSTANNYTIALGARADNTVVTGTYISSFVLTATANPATYTISYADNSGDSNVTNIPDYSMAGTTSSTSVELSGITPSRPGYAFAGWCYGTVSNSGTTCTGTTFAGGSTFYIDQTTANNITLYATWTNNNYGITINAPTGIDSVSLNGTVCSSTCTVSGLEGGKSYVLTATPSSYYTFGSWSKTNASSTIADTSASITTYTVDGATDTITPNVSTSGTTTVTVNYSYAGGGTTGAGTVTFTGIGDTGVTKTASGNGGTVQLKPGMTYAVTTTAAANYGTKSIALNSASNGTLDNADMAHVYFTPNTNNATLTVGTCMKTISGTMQTYSTNVSYLCDDASGTLTDSRDSQSYSVAKVTANNGGASSLWMTDNIRIGCNGATRVTRQLTTTNSNVSTTWSTSSAGDLTAGNVYDAARMQCTDATDTTTGKKLGAWYNYCAASAGTMCQDSSTTVTTETTNDICPAGWKLPSHSQIAGAASNKIAFSPVTGGYYYGGTLLNTGYGGWWSTGAAGGTNRWSLRYTGSYLFTQYYSRVHGFYVRCVKS